MNDSPGLSLLSDALRLGVRVVWDPPRFRGPSPALALAKSVPAIAREVLRRATIFRIQAQTTSAVPFLVLPEARYKPNGCISCGVPIRDRFRCEICHLAVHLALDLGLPEEEA